MSREENLQTIKAEIRYQFELYMTVCGDTRDETGKVRFIANCDQLARLLERLGLGGEDAIHYLGEAIAYVTTYLEPLNAQLSRG